MRVTTLFNDRSIIASRGDETYIIRSISRERIPQATQAIASWAANPDLSFTWKDATKMLAKLKDRFCIGC